ncbi:MAG: hypothetical protein VKJ06_05400 [Vampirovibrionales bacterium]|nr:hypothetical protein [Vampirovibrionales bacterium]
MKLAGKLSLGFASAAFMAVVLPPFFTQALDPTMHYDLLKSLAIGVGAALIMGLIGRLIGMILTHPKPARRKAPLVRPTVPLASQAAGASNMAPDNQALPQLPSKKRSAAAETSETSPDATPDQDAKNEAP